MPASTTLITDIDTVITAGPTAATTAKATNPNGPIMDYPGNCNLALLKLEETKVLLQQVVADTDAADPSLATLNNILASLS